MALLGLKRFSTTIYKDKAGADLAQVPTAATFDIYLQGVTVNGNIAVTTGGGGTSVTFYNINQLAVGDSLQVETNSGQTLTVVSITDDTHAVLQSTTGFNLSLVTGQRLIITNTPSRRPTMYADDQGAVSLGYQITAPSSTGLIEFYTSESRFDYIISGSDVQPQLFRDADGGWGTDVGPTGTNVRNYSTWQKAVDSMGRATAGRLHVPAGVYTSATIPTAGLNFTGHSRISIVGEGRATEIHHGSVTNDLFKFTQNDFVEVGNMLVFGGDSAGTQRGIVIDGCFHAHLHDMWLLGHASWAVDMVYDATTDNVNVLCENLRITNNYSNGCFKCTQNVFHPIFINCWFQPQVGRGIYLNQTLMPVFYGCVFEPDAANDPAGDGSVAAGLYSDRARGVMCNGCWFESHNSNVTPNNWFVFFTDNAPVINNSFVNCRIVRPHPNNKSLRFLKAISTVNGGTFIVENLDGHLMNGPTSGWGTDDIVLGSAGHLILKGQNEIHDDAFTVSAPIRLTGLTNTDTLERIASDKRFKHYVLSTTQRDALVDVFKGDNIFNGTNLVPEFYNGTGWQTAGFFIRASAGAPTGGPYAIGSTCLNTADSPKRVYWCTAAGSPGTWASTTIA